MKPVEFASYFVVTIITCYSILRVGEAFEPLKAVPPSAASSNQSSEPSSAPPATPSKTMPSQPSSTTPQTTFKPPSNNGSRKIETITPNNTDQTSTD